MHLQIVPQRGAKGLSLYPLIRLELDVGCPWKRCLTLAEPALLSGGLSTCGNECFILQPVGLGSALKHLSQSPVTNEQYVGYKTENEEGRSDGSKSRGKGNVGGKVGGRKGREEERMSQVVK